MNPTFIDTLLENDAFAHFPTDAQVHVLAQLGKWKEISKMSTLSKEQMILYKDGIRWEIAIDYFKDIPLEAIIIRKRSVGLYVVFNYFNLPKDLVRKKFLRNAAYHDRVEAVAIWYSSPECRHLIEEVYGPEILFNIENYTSYTFARHRNSIHNYVHLLKKYSEYTMIPQILFESHEDLCDGISTGAWFGCQQCPERDGCKHFPTIRYIKTHENVCRCGKIHSTKKN